MKITKFVSQATENRTAPAVQPLAATSETERKDSQPTRISKKFDELIRNSKETISPVNANNKPLRIIGSIKPYVHVGGMMELVNISARRQLAVPAIHWRSFWD